MRSPGTAHDVADAVGRVRDAQATALVHCGFGFGVVLVNAALADRFGSN